MTKIAVPTEELASLVGETDGVEVVVWDGSGDAPGDVALWVPPYMTHGSVIARVAELSNVRVVQLQSAGYEGVPEYIPAGVDLCNASGVHDDATAEHTVGLVLASLRGIPESVRQQGDGRWVRMPGRHSLADSKVLILGYGSIGRALAERLVPMKVELTGVASRAREDDLLGRVHGFDEVADLVGEQDVVVVLAPLNDATHHLVDEAFLARLKDGALVVNVARGPVVSTEAVLAEAGRLRFALDVTDPEPLPDAHPLWSAPGVLITPHVAGGTTAMAPRMAALVREQARRLLAGEPALHVVNA
jgi:phosphoglycerate dehydrogenase-like enzyme